MLYKYLYMYLENSNVTLNLSQLLQYDTTGLILGLHQANERSRYKITLSLIGWAQT